MGPVVEGGVIPDGAVLEDGFDSKRPPIDCPKEDLGSLGLSKLGKFTLSYFD